MFLEMFVCPPGVVINIVSVSSLDRCFWKFTTGLMSLRKTAGFSILFGSMFLEIRILEWHCVDCRAFQYPLWIDVFGNKGSGEQICTGNQVSVSSLDRCFWKCIHLSRSRFACKWFQYPLWIDVFGNKPANTVSVLTEIGFSILFGSMFLEIFGCAHACSLHARVSVSSLDRCFWKL